VVEINYNLLKRMEILKFVAAMGLGALGSIVYMQGYGSTKEKTAVYDGDANDKKKRSSISEESSEEDNDEVDEETLKWEPHKMVLVVRTDLKMGKGKIAAQCGHATLGAYKRAVKRTPQALECWETFGQAKVALKVDSEEQMMALAAKAKELNISHYIVVDAGRTQIAPDSKTVLAIGPAANSLVDQVTSHLKLM